MKKSTKKGFTLVELVIVIAIIAILAAVLIPTFTGIVTKAQKSKAQQAARNAYTEMMAYEDANLLEGTYDFATPTAPTGAKITAAELTAIANETGVQSAVVTGSGSAVTKIVFTLADYTVTYTPANATPWVVTP